MDIPETYNYLAQTRRDLWTVLRSTPDEVLSRPLLDGDMFHCIKDMVIHIPAVEDGWIQEDILGGKPVWDSIPELKGNRWGARYSGFALDTLLQYWQAVEQNTLVYLSNLTDDELQRIVTTTVDDAPGQYLMDRLLWHVMIHEMRHTAQIVTLLRLNGIKPPALDLLWYLPLKPSSS